MAAARSKLDGERLGWPLSFVSAFANNEKVANGKTPTLGGSRAMARCREAYGSTQRLLAEGRFTNSSAHPFREPVCEIPQRT
jgi:hypothetical protein